MFKPTGEVEPAAAQPSVLADQVSGSGCERYAKARNFQPSWLTGYGRQQNLGRSIEVHLVFLAAIGLLFAGCVPLPFRVDVRVPHDPVDKHMGEPWLAPGIPPPQQKHKYTENVALMSNETLWDLISKNDPKDKRALVALKVPQLNRGFFRGTLLITKSTFEAAKSDLLRTIPGLQESEREKPLRLVNGVELPIFYATIASKETLVRLRKSRVVDFVEPRVVFFDSIACGFDPYSPSDDPRAADGALLLPNFSRPDIVPYSYSHHHVQEAWNRFSRFYPGHEQGIAVLDSGVSSLQEQFFSRYSTPDFPRNSHLRLSETTDFTLNDDCFHGTKVASIAAAPREGYSVVGIAYNSPLITVKISYSPFAGRGDVAAICRGIGDAIRPTDGRPAARVVAMAFGLTYFSPTIAASIESAFQSSPNTVFVGAAGSNVTEVVFPANYKPFVTAVSMVELTPGGSGYRLMGRPLTVSYGPEVDFVSVSTAGGIPAAGKIGNTTTDEIARFRYSSAATGIYAGLFAVAGQYAQQQGWSRAQLLSAMRQAASQSEITDFSGEPLEAIVGAGIVDLYRATGGSRKVKISGPYQASAGTSVTLVAQSDTVMPPGAQTPSHISFEWFVNNQPVFFGHGPSMTFMMPSSRSADVRVVLRDSVDQHNLVASHTINLVAHVQPPVLRKLYWSSYVADWATFLNGGVHDRWVNYQGESMPPGCAVQDVRGVLMCRDEFGELFLCGGGEQVTIDRGNVGFTVTRPGGLEPNDLKTLVHQWHDGFSAVRTKVVYHVLQPSGVDCSKSNPPNVLSDTP